MPEISNADIKLPSTQNCAMLCHRGKLFLTPAVAQLCLEAWRLMVLVTFVPAWVIAVVILIQINGKFCSEPSSVLFVVLICDLKWQKMSHRFRNASQSYTVMDHRKRFYLSVKLNLSAERNQLRWSVMQPFGCCSYLYFTQINTFCCQPCLTHSIKAKELR